jgi:hypothetical protein
MPDACHRDEHIVGRYREYSISARFNQALFDGSGVCIYFFLYHGVSVEALLFTQSEKVCVQFFRDSRSVGYTSFLYQLVVWPRPLFDDCPYIPPHPRFPCFQVVQFFE